MSEVIERPTAHEHVEEAPQQRPPYPRFFKPMENIEILRSGRIYEAVCARVEKQGGAIEYRVPTEWLPCLCGKCYEATMDMDCAVGLWCEISPDEALLLIGGAL